VLAIFPSQKKDKRKNTLCWIYKFSFFYICGIHFLVNKYLCFDTEETFVHIPVNIREHVTQVLNMQAVPNTPDSYMYKGYLQQQGTDTSDLMQKLLQTAPWNRRDNPAMMMKGHKLKRTKFFAFAHDDPDLFLKYGYTGFQWSSLKLYKRWSSMPELKEAVQGMRINGTPALFNHIIGTLYKEEKDEIGAHHDKMKDIREGSDIISLSLGDKREFVLTSEDGDEKQRVVLEDGDLFVLGPLTNAQLKHAVLPVKHEQLIERQGAAVQPRISIVLRDIETRLSRAQVVAKIPKSERVKERTRQAKTYALTKT
jgi:alkylated DNA repair dioxygenase AlkB